jgi:hypothetical protein
MAADTPPKAVPPDDLPFYEARKYKPARLIYRSIVRKCSVEERGVVV